MKVRGIITGVVAVCIGFLFASSGVAASSGELLSGSGFGTLGVDGLPVGYLTDNWGSLTADFAFLSEGGRDFLRTEVSNYVDGDAKWYHETVAVEAGKQYVYSDLYRASVPTHYFAQVFSADGVVSYIWLGEAGVSVDWQAVSLEFSAPEGAVSAAFFHILNADGVLDTTDFSLHEKVTEGCATWIDGEIERICGKYTVSMAPGEIAEISLLYYAQTYLYSYVEIFKTDGAVDYIPLYCAPASTGEWSRYEDSFVVPENTTSMIVYVATDDPWGEIYIDNVAVGVVDGVEAGFETPMVSFNFDDGWMGSYTLGAEILEEYGMVGTYYLNGSTLGTDGYMGEDEARDLAAGGNEIGSHGYYHVDATTVPPAEFLLQAEQNKALLQDISGQGVGSFAVPFGIYDNSVLDGVLVHHGTVRDTSGALNYAYNFDEVLVHAKVITDTTTVAEIAALLELATQNKAWLVLVFHDITDEHVGDGYSISDEMFAEFVGAVAESGARVDTNAMVLSTIAG